MHADNCSQSNSDDVVTTIKRHGVYSHRAPCAPDKPCPPHTRHGYFETSPNADAVGLRIVEMELAAEIYASMRSVDGLAPCDFTLPNFPDSDDSCGDCDGGFGTYLNYSTCCPTNPPAFS